MCGNKRPSSSQDEVVQMWKIAKKQPSTVMIAEDKSNEVLSFGCPWTTMSRSNSENVNHDYRSEKMELQDDCDDDSDITSCNDSSQIFHNFINRSPSRRNTKYEYDAYLDKSYDAEGVVQRVIKRKFQDVRDVDILVDELIRKTNKSLGWIGENSTALVPNPSLPFYHPVSNFSSSTRHSDTSEGRDKISTRPDGDDSNAMKSILILSSESTRLSLSQQHKESDMPISNVQGVIVEGTLSAQNEKFSGCVTHSDWPIEEITDG